MPLPRGPSSGAVSAGTACLSPGTTPAYGDWAGCHPDTSRSRCSSRSRSRATHHRRDRGAATATTHNQDRSRLATDRPSCDFCAAADRPVASLDSVAPERVGQGTTSQQGRARSPRLRSTSVRPCSTAARPAADRRRAARGEGAMPPATSPVIRRSSGRDCVYIASNMADLRRSGELSP